MEKWGSSEGDLKLKIVTRKDPKSEDERKRDVQAAVSILKAAKATVRVPRLLPCSSASASVADSPLARPLARPQARLGVTAKKERGKGPWANAIWEALEKENKFVTVWRTPWSFAPETVGSAASDCAPSACALSCRRTWVLAWV
jgi:hypothetical protein